MKTFLTADNINIRRAQDTAFRKVTRLKDYKTDKTKVTEQDRALLERRNIGYRTFKNIRGTAPYFEHAKSRLFAFLRQKGPPTIFTTLSSAEFDWMVWFRNLFILKKFYLIIRKETFVHVKVEPGKWYRDHKADGSSHILRGMSVLTETYFTCC